SLIVAHVVFFTLRRAERVAGFRGHREGAARHRRMPSQLRKRGRSDCQEEAQVRPQRQPRMPFLASSAISRRTVAGYDCLRAMKPDIVAKLAEELRHEITSERQVVYLLVELRKLMELETAIPVRRTPTMS